jgi:hypothetical protein
MTPMFNSPSGHSKQKIGFTTDAPSIRMEEEESAPETYRSPEYGQTISTPLANPETSEFIRQLMRERELIFDAIAVKGISSKEKFRLLEENRRYMILLRGGSSSKFGTEKVIYAMLFFCVVIISILAWLTVEKKLEADVTTTFVGTVVGGMIATIAQKLGKVGR